MCKWSLRGFRVSKGRTEYGFFFFKLGIWKVKCIIFFLVYFCDIYKIFIIFIMGKNFVIILGIKSKIII